MRKIYPRELQAFASAQDDLAEAPRITARQMRELETRARRYNRWVSEHPHLNNLFNGMVFFGLFALLFAVNFIFFAHSRTPWIHGLLVALNGFTIYSIIIYTLHTGAGHSAIFRGGYRYAALLNRISANSNRILFCDPVFYRSAHIRHHRFSGTERDGSFTNFVDPVRFLVAIIPGWGASGFSDFKIHNGTEWTLSHLASQVLGILGVLAVVLWNRGFHGYTGTLLFVVASYSVAFFLDRIREATEHNLMHPGKDGARSFGTGFWAMLVGGGPWGQPCHLAHHLFPSLGWYHQICLHRDLEEILTSEQKDYYLIGKGWFAYPKLFVDLFRRNHAIFRKLKNGS